MEQDSLIEDTEFEQIDQLYDECLDYLKQYTDKKNDTPVKTKHFFLEDEDDPEDPDYESVKPIVPPRNKKTNDDEEEKITKKNENFEKTKSKSLGEALNNNVEAEFKVENEIIKELKSERLRRLSQQLPKIVITQSNTSIDVQKDDRAVMNNKGFAKSEGSIQKGIRKEYSGEMRKRKTDPVMGNGRCHEPLTRVRYGDYPKRLVSKSGMENVSLISNVPFEKIRLLNDTFHTLINLRWRWIVLGTIVTHFAIWLIFAVFWYIASLAHYDFSPNPPDKLCVTGGKDFVTIFLASVEAQTTIGFGDRAIDEECPESIFLFIMQLILGTGLSGVLTCVVYAKLTRPEKLSRDGVGFSKKAVISMRDGHLCLMMRAWDLNYDHIISSEFSAHFVHTYRTKENEIIRYYAVNLPLQQKLFLLWPVTLVHIIDEHSPLYKFTPNLIKSNNYEITVSLKGASASMGTFTQSQTSYTPKEIIWGHRFPPCVKYDGRKQKYVIEQKKLDLTEPVDTPLCSASDLYSSIKKIPSTPTCLSIATPSNFSDQLAAFTIERSSSFRLKNNNNK
ncbi:hypothetical protein O0L34_g1791 [Tuta absoluta]|nr:hypothetical protein O0L34_g1791 [Tuta absoluta]